MKRWVTGDKAEMDSEDHLIMILTWNGSCSNLHVIGCLSPRMSQSRCYFVAFRADLRFQSPIIIIFRNRACVRTTEQSRTVEYTRPDFRENPVWFGEKSGMKCGLEKNPVLLEKNPVFLEKNPLLLHPLRPVHDPPTELVGIKILFMLYRRRYIPKDKEDVKELATLGDR